MSGSRLSWFPRHDLLESLESLNFVSSDRFVRGDDTGLPQKPGEVSIRKWYIALKMPPACIPRETAA